MAVTKVYTAHTLHWRHHSTPSGNQGELTLDRGCSGKVPAYAPLEPTPTSLGGHRSVSRCQPSLRISSRRAHRESSATSHRPPRQGSKHHLADGLHAHSHHCWLLLLVFSSEAATTLQADGLCDKPSTSPRSVSPPRRCYSR